MFKEGPGINLIICVAAESYLNLESGDFNFLSQA